MKNRGKKWEKYMLGMLLMFSMLAVPAFRMEAAESASDETTVDFVLVLDCSGSMDKTDPNGLSVSAAKMFVDMIPMENARVGVVGFGGYWGDQAYVYEKNKEVVTCTTIAQPLVEIKETKNKTNIKAAIDTAAEKRGEKDAYTNLGYALQAANDMLHQENSEQGEACVVLMSDGRMTTLPEQLGETLEDAKEKNADMYWMEGEYHNVRGSRSLDAVLKDFVENEWPVYSLELNFDNGKGQWAETGRYQMERIAEECKTDKVTADSTEKVEKAFADIFAQFYSVDMQRKEGVIQNGKASLNFEVEEMIAEMNITVTGSQMDDVTAIELTDGKGNTKKYERKAKPVETDSRIVIFNDKNYAMIKLIQPQAGNWQVTAYGSDGIKINLMAIPMLEVNFRLNTFADPAQMIDKGSSVEFGACFVYHGQSISSEKFYRENGAKLEVLETGEKFDMTGSDDNYTGKVTFHQSGTYTVRATVESGRFRNGRKESGEITFEVKNKPSEILSTIDDADMGFQEKKEIDCTKYFSNPDKDEMIYKVEKDQTSGIKASIEKNVITLTSGIKAGEFEIRISANDGAMDTDLEQSFTIHIENHPLKEKGPGKITKTISYNVKGVPGFVKKLFHMDVNEVETIDANDYFEDPDGIPPVFEVKDLPEDSSIIVENAEPGILNVSGKSKGEVTFKLIAKDASDESISYEREVTVKSVSAGSYIWGNIWGIVVMLLIFLVLVAIFLLLTFAGRKIHGEWDITVGGRSEDEVKLRTCGAGKKKKCTLNAILRDLELPECESEQIMLKAGNNWTKPVFITGLEHAEEVEYRGKTYLAEEKPLTKAVMKKGQSIHINVNGTWITLNRL